MALKLIEGFRAVYGSSTTDWTTYLRKKGYFVSGTTSNYIGPYGRWSAPNNYGLCLNSAPYYAGMKYLNKTKRLYVGMALYKANGTPTYTTGQPFFQFYDYDNVTRLVRMHMEADFSISVYNAAGTLLGQTAGGVVGNESWFYFEAYIKADASAGEVIIRINEQVVLNLSAKNTDSGAAGNVGAIRMWQVNSAQDLYITDLYVDDAQFHGNCRVRSFVPDSDETHSDWTRNTGANDYECVDDIAPIDGDTTYIEGQNIDDKSSFGITTGALAEVVKGLAIDNYYRASNAGQPRRIQALVRSGGSDYKQPRSGSATTSYKMNYAVVEKDPQDNGTWNQSKIEAAEFGVALTYNTTTTSTTTTTTTTV